MENENNELYITTNPKSGFSESIKSIRTNLHFASVNSKVKVILITSPTPGDGKSFISSNLAGAYAQENKKVLIIDCDLRKGRQDKIFDIIKDNSKGFANLILNFKNPLEVVETKTEQINIKDYICNTKYKNIDLIPNGPVPPNPIELLSSSKNKNLIGLLKEKYDIIILDCPPVIGLSDTLILTKFSDANVLVVSDHKTKYENIEEVKKAFEKAGAPITGVVINKTKSKHNGYYGYYGYYGEEESK